ncbi:protein L-Myc isoform 2-T2 [Pelodytes ibericus]
MDFGSYGTHYFYDVDLKEDFYRCIAPSEDIWKKFELLPSCSLSSTGCMGGSGTDWGTDLMDLGWESPVKLSGLSSVVLLKDCMWSGFSTRERLEKVINERIAGANSWTGNGTKPAQEPDPHETGIDHSELAAPTPLIPAAAPGKVQHSSGSESTSDSEGEIDVVTVDKRKSYGDRQPVTIAVLADPLDTSTKLFFHISIHQQQHNYAAPPPEPSPSSPPQDSPITEEEPGEVSALSMQPCSPPTSSSSLPSGSSDNEDITKRKNHNYMERKRRNDLRSRFQALREFVPGLAKSSKPSKVVVLGKATEFLQRLVTEEQELLKEKLKLRARHKQLKRRLSQLKGR